MTALEDAIAGEPSVVVVGGEAGVGKTRLVEEAALRALDADARVLTGSCIELGGRGLPLSPFVDALRSLVRTMDPGELDELLGPSRQELARLLPELDPEFAMSLAPAAVEGNTRLLEMLFGLIGRLGARRPLMIAIEDLHWADQSTLDLASLLVRALRGVRVMLVLTFRSDELHRSHPLRPLVSGWERVRSVRRLELPRFNRDEAAGQLEAITGAPPTRPTLEMVYERSEGNAFLIEEILGALAAGAAPDELPLTLRDVLLARAERLSAPTISLLRVAAAAGRSVPDRLLATVAQVDEPSLELALREAVEHHLLVIDESNRGYRFRHALTRDAIYSDMLPRERVRIHVAYAEALSLDPALAGADASVAAQLALHWSAAHDIPRALVARIDAARQAAAYAPAEALEQLEHALELWPSVPDAEERCGLDIVEVLRLAASGAYASGDIDRSLALYDEALAEIDPGDQERLAMVLASKSLVLDDLGRDEEATVVVERAVSLLDPESATVARAFVLTSLAGRLMLGFDLRACAAAAAAAVQAAQAIGSREHEAEGRIIHGSALAYLSETDEGLDELRRGIEIAESLGNHALTLRGYLNLSDALQAVGEHQHAADQSQRGVDRAAEVGLTRHTYGGYLMVNRVEALSHLGRWAEAREAVDAAIAMGLSPLSLNAMLIHRATIAALDRRFDDAEEDLRAVAEMPSVQFSLPTAFARSLVAAGTGRFGEGRELIARALNRGPQESIERYEWPLVWTGLRIEADSGDPEAERVRALLDHGAGLPARSRQDRAYKAFAAIERARASGEQARWSETVAPARDSGDPFLLGYALVETARQAVAAGDREGAEGPLFEAIELAAQRGITSLLADAQALGRRARLRVANDPAQRRGERDLDSYGLTEREREVLNLVAAGRSNPQIAAELFISPKTASVHVSNIIGKLNVTSRGEAAALAHRLGVEPATQSP